MDDGDMVCERIVSSVYLGTDAEIHNRIILSGNECEDLPSAVNDGTGGDAVRLWIQCRLSEVFKLEILFWGSWSVDLGERDVLVDRLPGNDQGLQDPIDHM